MFQELDNEQLIMNLKSLVGDERVLIVKILDYLKEVEVRQLHLARGYSSMFAFCTEHLNYSDAEAHIRIQAMRLSKEIPEVKMQIEAGELSLSVTAMAQSAFRKENRKRKVNRQSLLTVQQKREVIFNLTSCSKSEAQTKLAQKFEVDFSQKELRFSADERLQNKIGQLKNLLAHQNYDGDLSKLIELMADMCLKQLLKTKQLKELKNHNAPILGQAKCRPSQTTRSRYISKKVRREVWAKSNSQCNFVDQLTGKKCQSRHALEIDHIHEFAKGGAHALENLTLLCGAHNKFRNFVST